MHILAYINDTSAVVPYLDVKLFCRRFAELGKPLSAALNPVKTKILIATNVVMPLPFLPRHLFDPINVAIKKCAAREQCTDGVRILGFPVGGLAFAKTYLKKTLEDINQDVLQVSAKL